MILNLSVLFLLDTMQPHLSSRKSKEIISHHGIGSLVHDHHTGQRSLLSAYSYKTGDIIIPFEHGAVMNHPTKYTVQINDNTHIILKPLFLQYINHSCSPNTFFDTDHMVLKCLTGINEGDEFSFFYPSTEWSMTEPFNCFCGTASCIQEIRGARYIPQPILERYRLTNYIKNKIHHCELTKSTGP